MKANLTWPRTDTFRIVCNNFALYRFPNSFVRSMWLFQVFGTLIRLECTIVTRRYARATKYS